jgi:DNA modification methylase
MNNIPDKYIDLIFTSPPYYNAKDYSFYNTYEEYLEFINQTIKQYYRILSDDGFFILNTSPVITSRISRNSESIRHPIPFDTYQIAKENGFKYIDDIIWEKPDGASNRGRKFSENRRPMAYKPFTITEYLFVFRKNNAPLKNH